MFIDVSPQVLWVIISISAVIALILIILLVFFLKKGKKHKKIKVDEEFINNLISLLGSEKNIKNVLVDNGRLKIEVNDLETVNLEGIKSISETGLFVTGNIIKVLFKHDSFLIKSILDKRI